MKWLVLLGFINDDSFRKRTGAGGEKIALRGKDKLIKIWKY